MDEEYWKDEARFILRAHMRRSKIGFKKLSAKLEEIGIHETEANLSNKIRRGTFSFVFYLQCTRAMGMADPSITRIAESAGVTEPN